MQEESPQLRVFVSGKVEAENHSFVDVCSGNIALKRFYSSTVLWMSTGCGIFEAKLWYAVDNKN